ncbi:hypothetical protein PUN28_010466 [Cardiocondyla obscurior]|uniref:Uncharacterized protein n=1 Tax=Cardiocondyla obscurior TaxID=286306 RepID=A0AAW2FHL9_9HYME
MTIRRSKVKNRETIWINLLALGTTQLQEAITRSSCKMGQVHDEQDKRQKEAEATKLFWENSGKLEESLILITLEKRMK